MKTKSYFLVTLCVVLIFNLFTSLAVGAVGNTVFVDGVFGNDTTGTRQNEDQPFLTLGAAKNAALSGDTIIVRPGTYNERNLLKNGVNWHFIVGAIVSYNGSSAGYIFDDSSTGSNGAVTSTISGEGRFLSASSANAATGVLQITNPSTVINFAGEYAYATNSSTGSPTTMMLIEGSISARIRKIELLTNAQNTAAVTWQGGSAFIEADEVTAGGPGLGASYCIWSIPPSIPSGQFYVNARLIQNLLSSGVCIYTQGNSTQRTWVTANQILCTNGPSIIALSGFTYVTAEKILGQITAYTPLNARLYVTAQKLSPSTLAQSLIDINANSMKYVTLNINQIEDTGLTGIPLITLQGATNKVQINNADIRRTTTGDAIRSGCNLTLTGCSIQGVTSGFDLNQTAGTMTVLGCRYNLANTSGTITDGNPRVAIAPGFGVGTALPANGNTYQFFRVGSTIYGWNGSSWDQLN
jgi:hypothetical protein